MALWALAGLLVAAAAPAGPSEPDPAAAAVDARLDRLFGEHDAYRKFLHDLQAAVVGDLREQLAGMVSYPLSTKLQGRAVRIRTPRQFLSHYETLLPVNTRQLIAQQSYEQLFATSAGVMIGSGELWFSGVCKDEACSSRAIKIIALNPAR